jgi:hypothetical protein
LNENASCLTFFALFIGYIIGANILEGLAAYFFTVVSFDYPEDGSNEWYLYTILHGFIFQKLGIFIITAVIT